MFVLLVSSCRIRRNSTSDTGRVWPPPYPWLLEGMLYALWCPIPGHREHLPPHPIVFLLCHQHPRDFPPLPHLPALPRSLGVESELAAALWPVLKPCCTQRVTVASSDPKRSRVQDSDISKSFLIFCDPESPNLTEAQGTHVKMGPSSTGCTLRTRCLNSSYPGRFFSSAAMSAGQDCVNALPSWAGLQKAPPPRTHGNAPAGAVGWKEGLVGQPPITEFQELQRRQLSRGASWAEDLSLRPCPGCQVQEAHPNPYQLGDWREPDGHGGLCLNVSGSLPAHRPQAGPQRPPGLFSAGHRVRQGTGQGSRHRPPPSHTQGSTSPCIMPA